MHGDADDSAWSDEEKLLIRMVDELHDSAHLSDEVWDALAAAFSVEQIFELIALVGFYHTVSFFANGLRLAPESYGVPFPRVCAAISEWCTLGEPALNVGFRPLSGHSI